jgi:hypothetical protein
LASVVFESDASLQAMIENKKVDLEGNFNVYLVEWDGLLSFRGYSVRVIAGADHSFRLVKKRMWS